MPPKSWQRHVAQALLLLVGVAIGARVMWGMLEPLLPVAVIGVVLVMVYRVVLWRRWR